MSEKKFLLLIGLGLSLVIHLSLFRVIYSMSQEPPKKRYQSSYLVPVQPPKPKPKPEPPPPVEKPKEKPKKIVRVTEKTKVAKKPVPHDKTPPKQEEKVEDVKPVFGVTEETVVAGIGPGVGVRVGNTLMMEQEEEYTPPEEVKPYKMIPSYELSSLPVVIKRIKPDYPTALEDDELEGEAILVVTIDESGAVIDVEVKFSDHELFTAAAIKAMKKFEFKPATLNGAPVATEIDYTVTFVLD